MTTRRVYIDERLHVEWPDPWPKDETGQELEYQDYVGKVVVVASGEHRGKLGDILCARSYTRETTGLTTRSGLVNLRLDDETSSEVEFRLHELQPLIPKVYAFSCRYDCENADKTSKDYGKAVRPLESAEMVQEYILNAQGLLGDLCTGSQLKDQVPFTQPESPPPAILAAALSVAGAPPIQSLGGPWKGELRDLCPHADESAVKTTIDPVPIRGCPRATLIWNPNHIHLNGKGSDNDDCRQGDTSKDCNGDASKDYVCASLERGEQPPCWRSNYYAGLRKHKALFQIVEHGELGTGQQTEVRMAKRLGIIPADFDSDANLASRETYVSPSLRFIRIHTAPVGRNNEVYTGSTKQDRINGAILGLCGTVCCPVFCPIWCCCVCCCGIDIKEKLLPTQIDALRDNRAQITSKLSETPLGGNKSLVRVLDSVQAPEQVVMGEQRQAKDGGEGSTDDRI